MEIRPHFRNYYINHTFQEKIKDVIVGKKVEKKESKTLNNFRKPLE